jgi:DNA-binding PadR family transcriptional regulator
MGLLTIQPMSGYELWIAADKSIAHFWPISKTQMYQELARLEELGLVDGARVPQEKVPDKRVFSLTPAGDEAFDRWLETSTPGAQTLRSPFLVRLFFGHRMSRDRLRELVQEERRCAVETAQHLAQIVEMLASEPDAAHARITALHGQRECEAIVAWADEVEPQLPDVQHRPDPRRKEAPTATRLFQEVPARQTSKR